MSRFPAELTVTLSDGKAVTEYFNQAEMAYFTRERMMECLRTGKPLVVFDGECMQIAPDRVRSVQVMLKNPIVA